MAYTRPKLWQNQYTNLFLIEKDYPTYLCVMGVFRIICDTEKGDRVILYSHYPRNIELLHADGVTFELMMGERGGVPDMHSEQTLIARFSNCKVRRYWMARPKPLYADECEVLRFHVEYDCDVFMPEIDPTHL